MRNIKHIVEERAKINDTIRAFFNNRDFIEVETPKLVASPGMEPNLSPFSIDIEEPSVGSHLAGLITSPEYAMKKLLANGLERIFTLTHVFRDQEEWGGVHNPEFSMLEWYRQGQDYHDCMNEIEELIGTLGAEFDIEFPEFRKIPVSDLFLNVIGIDPATNDRSVLIESCEKHALRYQQDDTMSDLFFRLFIGKVEPAIPDGPVFLYDYPFYQAALADVTDDGLHGQRFELYIDGLELCNGFTELTDEKEQRERFEKEQQTRTEAGKTVFPIDETLLESLSNIKNPTYGNALGVDRLHMVLTGRESIADVIPFPANTLFT